ncbi:MAG: hypothetical protein FRX49_12193 [Trebouxia sp. A1-2]|nr:MAG: hypothetical protein FRX49_12193 [Trebouxia sp. A1-2]
MSWTDAIGGSFSGAKEVAASLAARLAPPSTRRSTQAGAREKTKGIYLKVHDDGGMQWGDIQVQVVPSNSDVSQQSDSSSQGLADGQYLSACKEVNTKFSRVK